MIKLKLFILIFISCLSLTAQDTQPEKKKETYYRKEEMIYDGKRYRVHNSYLSLGGGFLQSSIRNQSQKTLGVDFQFPIRRLNFQMGAMVSGDAFGSDNNRQVHVGYGLRKESRAANLAAYIGPTYFWGVKGDTVTGPKEYQGLGGYICLQAVRKISFDIGVGIEIFGEINKEQQMFGFRLIVFFSGAYQGARRNYNPNVRLENPR